jgi:large subunit ribosomal protein L24
MHVRKGDLVEVTTGDDAGNTQEPKVARVLRVLNEENKVVVEGINRVYKHLKPNRRNAQGGRLSKEMPVCVSNVLLYCAACRRGVRIGRRYKTDGSKERYCKKCGAGLGAMSNKPNPKYATKKS